MFSVSDKARDYILSKSGAVFLEGLRNTAMCCGSINLEPSVRLGKPSDTDNYNVEEINRVKVYIPNGFILPDRMVIDIKKFLWFKTLTILGWKLI